MALLTRASILTAADRKTETVAVPEWGGEVLVSEMSGSARDAYEQSLLTKDGKPNMQNLRARMAALCIVDENGDRLFTDDDVLVLGRKSAHALERVCAAAMRLNAMNASAVEDAVKN